MRRDGSMKVRITVAAAALAAVGLTGCASANGGSPGTGSTPGAVPTASAVAYSLYTHCGIDEANIAGRWFEADTRLSDRPGSGNPPKGWDNPFQQGTMRMLSGTAAEFRDAHGHVVRFHLRINATGPKRFCT
jgi:hypothetical protein